MRDSSLPGDDSTKTAVGIIYCCFVAAIAGLLVYGISEEINSKRPVPAVFQLSLTLMLLSPVGIGVRWFLGKTAASGAVIACAVLCGSWFGFVAVSALPKDAGPAEAPRPAEISN